VLAARHPAVGAGRSRTAAARRAAVHQGRAPEPVVFDYGGTYVQTDAVFTHNVTHEWNHGIGEIVTALLDAGMTLIGLTEHDSVPWNALP
jgi:hypothetical protein